MINHLDIVLPAILVVIAFLLKLFMDRSVTAPLVVRSLYELPVDVLFLALSFSVAVAISTVGKREAGLFHAFVFLVVVLLSVVGWRRSVLLFEAGRKVWSLFVFVVNISAAAYCLTASIGVLVGGQP